MQLTLISTLHELGARGHPSVKLRGLELELIHSLDISSEIDRRCPYNRVWRLLL